MAPVSKVQGEVLLFQHFQGCQYIIKEGKAHPLGQLLRPLYDLPEYVWFLGNFAPGFS